MDSDYLLFIPWLLTVCWQLYRLVREDCRG